MPRDSRSRKSTVVDAARLCDAADAILQALHSEQGRRGVVRVLVVDPGAAGVRPGFTLAELTEAMNMLLRLGLVEPVRRGPEAG